MTQVIIHKGLPDLSNEVHKIVGEGGDGLVNVEEETKEVKVDFLDAVVTSKRCRQL